MLGVWLLFIELLLVVFEMKYLKADITTHSVVYTLHSILTIAFIITL